MSYELWASSPSAFLLFPHIPAEGPAEGAGEVTKPGFFIAVLERLRKTLGFAQPLPVWEVSCSFFLPFFVFVCRPPRPRGCCPVSRGRNLSADKVRELMAPLAADDAAGLASSVSNC